MTSDVEPFPSIVKRIPAQIQVRNGEDWIPVQGILDPGADETFVPACLSPFCRDVEALHMPMRIRNPNATASCSKQRARMDLHIATEHAEVNVLNAEVYIVEGVWPEFLVGAPLLTMLNCMPEQALHFHGETIDCLQLERKCRSVKVVPTDTENVDLAFCSEIPIACGMRCRRTSTEEPATIPTTGSTNAPFIHSIGNLPPDDEATEESYLFQKLENECMDRCAYADTTTEEADVRERIRQALVIRLANCEGPGISPDQLDRVREILERNLDAFGCDQAACKLSKLSPMKVELKHPHIKPCVAKARNFGTVQIDFLRKKIDVLVKIGMLVECPDPTFSSACFVVPKKIGNDFRMVVDMRPLNRLVKKSGFSMPLMEDQLGHCVSAQYFGTFDVLSGYDMLRVDPDSQKYFGLVTPFGVFNMTGAPMGFANSAQVYSARMISEVLGDLFARAESGIVQWLDDSLVYAPTFESYLTVLETFLQKLQTRGVRLNVDKCSFITRTAHWCGRTISDGTWGFEDSYYDTITNMSPPRTADELAQAIHVANWLASTIPDATAIVHPLRQVLENAYTMVGRRRTKKIKGIPLVQCGWTDPHLAQWHLFRDAVARSARLATYDPELELCVLSDASDHFYAACLTQITAEEVELPLPEQHHRPLFFVSGEFKANMTNWHISQKEMWPVLKVFERFKFICAVHPRTIWAYNDHQSLSRFSAPPILCRWLHLDVCTAGLSSSPNSTLRLFLRNQKITFSLIVCLDGPQARSSADNLLTV